MDRFVLDLRDRELDKMMDTNTTSLSLSSVDLTNLDLSASSLKLKDLLSPNQTDKVLRHRALLYHQDRVVPLSLQAKHQSSATVPPAPFQDLLHLPKAPGSPYLRTIKDTLEAPLVRSLAMSQLDQHLVLLVRVLHSGLMAQLDSTRHQAHLVLLVPLLVSPGLVSLLDLHQGPLRDLLDVSPPDPALSCLIQATTTTALGLRALNLDLHKVLNQGSVLDKTSQDKPVLSLALDLWVKTDLVRQDLRPVSALQERRPSVDPVSLLASAPRKDTSTKPRID